MTKASRTKVDRLTNPFHPNLRELQNVFETTNYTWTVDRQSILKRIKKDKEAGRLSDASLKTYTEEYDSILQLGYKQQKKQSGHHSSRPKEICLLDRLKNYKTQMLLFMYR